MANLTQKEIEAKIKAFEKEMEKMKKYRGPVSKAEFVLNEMSIAQKGKHLEVLNSKQNGIGSQDTSIKVNEGGFEEVKQTEGIEK